MNKIILKVQNALTNKKAEMYVSKVVWTLAVIIVGMLLMWGIYELTNAVILPRLETAIEAIFTQADTEICSTVTGSYTPSLS